MKGRSKGWTTGPIKNWWRSTCDAHLNLGPHERGRPGAMDDARGFRKVPASVPDLLHASPRSSRELGWQRRKLVLGALLASISAVALLRVGVRPTRASDRLAADDPWDYLDDHLPPDDSLTASASLASDRLFRLGLAGRAPSAPRVRRGDRPEKRRPARRATARHPRPQHGRPHHERRRRRRLRRHPAPRRASPSAPRRTASPSPPPSSTLAFVSAPGRSSASAIASETTRRRSTEGSTPPSGDRCATPRTSSAGSPPHSPCVRRTTRDGVLLLSLLGFAGFRNRVVVEPRSRRREQRRLPRA